MAAAAARSAQASTRVGRAGSRSRAARRGTAVCVRAAAESTPQGPVAGLARGMGFNVDEGIFGFTPFAELWTGRLAMIGIASGMAVELTSGVPILQQVGISTPDERVFDVLLFGAAAATAVATARTLLRASSGDLTATQVVRYKSFFGLGDEEEAAAYKALKASRGPDAFTPGDDSASIGAARAEGTPADAFLAQDDSKAISEARAGAEIGALSVSDEGVEEAAAALKASTVEAAQQAQQQPDAVWLPEWDLDYEMRYAKDVEVTNGRWAMLGFWAAITLEALSGDGIFRQLVFYAKFAGIIDDTSAL